MFSLLFELKWPLIIQLTPPAAAPQEAMSSEVLQQRQTEENDKSESLKPKKKFCQKHRSAKLETKQASVDSPPPRPEPPRPSSSSTPVARRSHSGNCRKLSRSHSTSSSQSTRKMSESNSSNSPPERPAPPTIHQSTTCYPQTSKGNSHMSNSTDSNTTYSNHTGGSITHTGQKFHLGLHAYK